MERDLDNEGELTAIVCPRCGGPVQRQQIPGSATDPRDPLPSDHHFWCSPCGKLWHPIEMPRRGGRVRLSGSHCSQCHGEGVVGICSAHQTRDDGCETCDRPITCTACGGNGS